MPDYISTLDFNLRYEDYGDVSESIAVRLYVGDTLIISEDYPIRNYRHKEPMDQLGLSD